MRVLTLREPWASLIGEKIKVIETRSWPTKYRGELYIHAGLTKVSKDDQPFIELLNGDLHYGNIFVKCNLIDCIKITNEYADYVLEDNPTNFMCGNFAEGRYAWVLEDIEYIDPIPAKGHLSIWRYNE